MDEDEEGIRFRKVEINRKLLTGYFFLLNSAVCMEGQFIHFHL